MTRRSMPPREPGQRVSLPPTISLTSEEAAMALLREKLTLLYGEGEGPEVLLLKVEGVELWTNFVLALRAYGKQQNGPFQVTLSIPDRMRFEITLERRALKIRRTKSG